MLARYALRWGSASADRHPPTERRRSYAAPAASPLPVIVLSSSTIETIPGIGQRQAPLLQSERHTVDAGTICRMVQRAASPTLRLDRVTTNELAPTMASPVMGLIWSHYIPPKRQRENGGLLIPSNRQKLGRGQHIHTARLYHKALIGDLSTCTKVMHRSSRHRRPTTRFPHSTMQ